jgi:hypothetical protein
MQKPKPLHTVLCLLEILLKKPGKTFSIQQFKQAMYELSFEVSDRLLQRTLNELYAFQDLGYPIGLTRLKGSPGNQFLHYLDSNSPLLKASSQTSLKMLLGLLSHGTPLSQRFELDEQFAGIDKFLEHIYVAPESVLLPALEDAAVVETVYAAIQQKRYLALHYQNARLQQTEFDFYPWGVMFKGQNSYLIGNKAGTTHAVTLAVYRISRATMLERQETLTDGPNSSFRAFCETRGIAWFLQDQPEMLKISLHFFNSGGHLAQMKLAADQQLTRLPASEQKFPRPAEPDYFEMLVTATVPDSRKLDEWILSFGAEVEVLTPATLRQRIYHKLQQTTQLYQPANY